jgi:DNA-binding MarR family transcriptional regulator
MSSDYFRVKFCYDQLVSDDLVDDPRITAIGLFSEAYTGLTGRLAGHIAEHGLALIEFEVLIRLSRSPEGQLRMTDLSTQTTLTSSGVTRVVDRLERDGLVRRTACPSDRRSSYTVITRAGRERLISILPGHLDVIDQWFTGLLAPDHLTSMLAGLRVIRDAVRPGATAGASSATAGPDSAADPAGAGAAR